MKTANITVDAMEEEMRQPQADYVNTTAFDAKNYLNTKLDKGQTTKDLRIRILPINKDSSSAFQKIYTHNLKVPAEISKNGWKSYICLEKTDGVDHENFGDKCPFCETQRDAYAKKVEYEKAGDKVNAERYKKISLANKATESCIIRCIERGHEADGPKFWKFNVRQDGLDPKSQIIKLYKDRYNESIEEALDEYGVKTVEELPEDFEPTNILDTITGRDLKVTINAVKNSDGTLSDKTSVTIVDYAKSKPLSPNEEEANAWINDEKVWSDVFVTKPYDYCSILIEGGIPFYDKTNKKWVPKTSKKDAEEKNTSEEEKIKEAEKKAAAITVEYDAPESEETEEAEDLPF